MASNLLINVTTKGVKGATKGIKKLSGALGSLTKVALVGATGGAIALGVAMKKTTEASGKFEKVSQAFNNLAKSSGFSEKAFQKFKSATDGTVNSIELMEMANNSMLLGIVDNEDQMAKMFDTAQRLASAVGQDTAFGVNSLVTGLGRQSKLMLDNLGIMVNTEKANKDYAKSIGKSVSQLTEQERKTAFVNASLSEADKLVNKLGKENLTTADRFFQLKSTMMDTSIAIGTAVTPAVNKVLDGLGEASVAVGNFASAFANIDFKATFENMKNNLSLLGQLIIDSFKLSFSFLPDIFKFAFNKILPIGGKVLMSLAEGVKKLGGFLFEPLSIGVQIVVGKIKNAFIIMTNFAKEQFNSLAGIANKLGADIQPMEMSQLIDLEGLSMANTEIVQLFKQGSEDNINNFGDLANAQLELYKDFAGKIIISNKEIEKSEDDKNNKIVAGTKATGKVRKELTKEELKGYAKTSGSASDAMKSVVKAESMEAIAGFIASIFKTVPFPLNAVLAAGAGATVSGLIDQGLSKIPSFATGGDFIANGDQLIRVGDNPSQKERVQITPLGNDPAPNAPSGGGAITLNISAPLVDDTVVDSIIPAIREAVRRGEVLV